MVNRASIKDCCNYIYDLTDENKFIEIIDFVRDNNRGEYLENIITDGNGWLGLYSRAKDEKINFYSLIEHTITDRYDEILYKLGAVIDDEYDIFD